MTAFKLIQAVCLVGFVFGAQPSMGEILNLPGGGLGVTQTESSPQRGDKTSDVLERFGEPVVRHDAVGTPAISSWEYLEFKVYFENDVVIHAVHQAR